MPALTWTDLETGEVLSGVLMPAAVDAKVLWQYKTSLEGQLLSHLIKGLSSAGLVVRPSLSSSSSSNLVLGPYTAYVRDISLRASTVLLPMVLVETIRTETLDVSVAEVGQDYYLILVYSYAGGVDNPSGATPLVNSYYSFMLVSDYEALDELESSRVETTVYRQDICVLAKFRRQEGVNTAVEPCPWLTSAMEVVTLNEAQIINGLKTFSEAPVLLTESLIALGSKRVATAGQLYSMLRGSQDGLNYEGTIQATSITGAIFME